MDRELNTPIKGLITKFPKLADILNKYNIGCVPCNVGSCLLKDIVEIHNLSLEDEQELMVKIAKVIYPDKKVEIPRIKRKVKLHHAKEEAILFKYFDPSLDIIKTMLEDHETGRSHVRAVIEAVDKGDKKALVEHLNGYKELLTEHIKKEDEILYPWMDRNLSTTQVGELFAKFNEADEKIGKGVQEKYGRFIMKVEKLTKKPVTSNQNLVSVLWFLVTNMNFIRRLRWMDVRVQGCRILEKRMVPAMRRAQGRRN